jgi:hypothetical protein
MSAKASAPIQLNRGELLQALQTKHKRDMINVDDSTHKSNKATTVESSLFQEGLVDLQRQQALKWLQTKRQALSETGVQSKTDLHKMALKLV